MSKAVNSINQVESNVYVGRSDKLIQIKFIVINPDNVYDDRQYDDLRSVLSELMCTEIGDKLMEDYIDSIEGRFDEDEFSGYCLKNVETVAAELNFRIMRVLK